MRLDHTPQTAYLSALVVDLSLPFVFSQEEETQRRVGTFFWEFFDRLPYRIPPQPLSIATTPQMVVVRLRYPPSVSIPYLVASMKRASAMVLEREGIRIKWKNQYTVVSVCPSREDLSLGAIQLNL